MTKQRIGVFFGSRSPEHDVSVITGEYIIAELKKMGYPVTPVYIGKDGSWNIGDELGALKFFSDPEHIAEKLKYHNLNQFVLDLEKSRGKMVFHKKGLFNKEIVIDIAFPAFHGSFGEDGTVQGVFEMLNVPYVGCDVTSSAVTMDKVLTKLLYQTEKIPTTPFMFFSRTDWEMNKSLVIKNIREQFTGSVFIKPARLGSSIGIAKVKNLGTQDLEFRIEVALQYDSKVLVEEAVEPMADITCAVLGDEKGIVTSLLQESVFNSDLFGFEEKYLNDGGAQLGQAENNLFIPARIDEVQTKEMREMAARIFKIFGCSGIARVDFLFNTRTKQFFANEINTLPGTLYHHLWKKSGLEMTAVLDKLIDVALVRHAANQKVTHTFNSAILKQANSLKLGPKV